MDYTTQLSVDREVQEMKALVTGSGGLVGSECVRTLCAEGWNVIGVDNDCRRSLFGTDGSTEAVVHELTNTWPEYATTSSTFGTDRQSAI